ncbi:MAG: 30S ribosomal protein S2 [Candidatus Paceibacterota bacterium]
MTTETKNSVKVDEVLLEQMAQEGLVFGRRKARTNPKMKGYIFATRAGFEFFDLEKTATKLEEAKTFLASVAKTGKPILFVGSTPAAAAAVKATAEKFKAPFVVHRWLGGTLTNFDTIQTRLKYYLTLKADKASGRLDKYTKKERTQFDKELERLSTLFGGLEGLNSMPGAVVVMNAKAHDIAVKEAVIAGVPVVALVNTDTNPAGIDYVIPGNDNSVASIGWVMKQLEGAISK